MSQPRTIYWKEYPYDQPICDGYYLVTIKKGREKFLFGKHMIDVGVCKWFSDEKRWDIPPFLVDEVIAWAEPPEPYKP